MRTSEDKYREFLKRVVAIHALLVATILVLYLIGDIVLATSQFLGSFHDWVAVPMPGEDSELSASTGKELIQSLAFTLILYKAFVIILHYSESLHIEVPKVLEIAIVASVVELIFNWQKLSLDASIIFLVLGLGSSVMYLLYLRFGLPRGRARDIE